MIKLFSTCVFQRLMSHLLLLIILRILNFGICEIRKKGQNLFEPVAVVKRKHSSGEPVALCVVTRVHTIYV